MTYVRHKNMAWGLKENASQEEARLAVLMDIRDELQALNRIIACPNFLQIPRILREIRRNTTKKRKRRKA